MKLYRIEYTVDYDNKVNLVLLEFKVIRKTPKGGYIKLSPYSSLEKWVGFNHTKAYAYLTIQQARTNFIKRNQTRQRILQYHLHNVEESLKKIETFHKPKTKK